MSRFPPEHRLERFRPGDVAYLRVRIEAGVKPPFSLLPRVAASVFLIDSTGKNIDGTSHFVPESALISNADAFRIVKEALR